MSWTRKQLKDQISPDARDQRGIVRRMIVRFTDEVLWQLTGHRLAGGTETIESEVFSGVGYYARPRAGKNAEAILARIGEAQHTVIIATRDEDLRALWKAELDAGVDVAAMFNSASIVLVKPDGKVEIRSRGGSAKELTFKDELSRFKTAIDVAVEALTTAGGPTAAPAIAALNALKAALEALVPPWPQGTTTIRGD